MIPTLRNFEEKFNKNFRYPYVVFSSPDEPDFSNDFKSTVAATLPPDAITEYSRIAEKDWSIPKSMDREAVLTGFEKQGQTGVQYGFREGYHHMCRWYSGVFATEKALEKYDWYWRLEAGGEYFPLSVPS